MKWWRPLLLAGSIMTVLAGDIDSVSLLARVQSKVRDNARRIPRYVCRQGIERQGFASVNRYSRACGTLSEQEGVEASGLSLIVADRAHLDVMLTESSELFSWPGERRFDTNSPDDLLVGGMSGSGDFAAFVISVFTFDQVTFEYLGACEGGYCVRYRFNVPREASRYLIKGTLVQATVGYHGTFDVNPQTADLMQMTVVPTDLSEVLFEACDFRTRMTFTSAITQAGEFMIPASTEMKYLAKDGSYSLNRMWYESCRQFTSESVLTFGDDLPKTTSDRQSKVSATLPVAGSEVRLRLASKIDSDVASAGDSLEATLVRPVRNTEGGSVPAGTIVRGHLAQLERIFLPQRQVVIAIRFDTIVLNGAAVPIRLDGIRKVDTRGRGIFTFSGPRVVLDQQFVSQWRVWKAR
jgi:hypothetical protein